MESSSDESFAWRIDSKQNSDSEDMSTQMENVVENGLSPENTCHSERRAKKRKNEGHIESPKRKKNKSEQERHMDKYKSVDIAGDDDDNHLTMKVKHKKHGPEDNNEIQELNPEEVKPKKSKRSKEFRNINKSINDLTYDENYLTVKAEEEQVQSEEHMPKKSKKMNKKKKCKLIGDVTDDDGNYLTIKAKEEILSSEEVTPNKLKKLHENKETYKSIDKVGDDDNNYLSMKAKQEELSTEEIIPKKKKKSKELVMKTDCVEETNEPYMSDYKNVKKRKSIDMKDNGGNYLTLKAKDETPSSDEIIPKKSKKVKKNIGEITDDDGNYLSMKAKQEEFGIEENKPKNKKKKKSKELVTESDCVKETNGVHMSDFKNIKKSIDDVTDNDENFLTIKAKEERLSSGEVIFKKSKKANENMIKYQSNDDDDDDYLSMKAKQEEIDTKEITTKSKKKRISKELTIENDYVEEINEPHRADNSVNLSCAMNRRNVTFMDDHQDSFVKTPQSQAVDKSRRVSKENESFKNDESTFNDSSASKKIVQTPRMSDRIRFEDDESEVETPVKKNEDDAVISARLRHFLKAHPRLNTIREKSSNMSTITDNDEIWMLKCPFEMDVSALSGKEINLGSECKIKTNDDSYYSTVQNESISIAVMTYEQNKRAIQNRLCKSIVSFRKRIPKLHIQDDRSIYQDPSHCIPLPETKSRHPLFGSNYKKAIKISKHVAQRLNSNSNSSLLLDKERKKKKKREKQLKSLKVEPMESEPTPAADVVRKKRKKERKQIEDTEPPRKVKKKHNLESPEVWESETKIEESLFDF